MADFFDPDLVGSLPDVRVPDASPGDWQAVLDLVRESGSKHEYLEGAAMLPVPRAAAVLSRPPASNAPSSGWSGRWTRLDVLCGFPRAIGRRLRKPVLMEAEGSRGRPVLGFDIGLDRVVPAGGPHGMREGVGGVTLGV